MKKISSLLFIFTIIFSGHSFAADILAVVNDKPITKRDFHERLKFLKLVNNLSSISQEQETALKNTALKSLIDDQLFIQQGDKNKLKITDKDVDNAITRIEAVNKMPAGQFKNMLKANNIDLSTLTSQIRAQIIRENLVQGQIAANIDVSKSEVEDLASLSGVDYKINYIKIASVDHSKSSLSKMRSYAKKVKSCGDVKDTEFSSFALQTNYSGLLSKISGDNKELLKKLNNVSDIIDDGNSYVFYIICNKEFAGDNEKQYDFIASSLANKKIAIQAQKFYDKIKKQAFIKIYQ